jgi:hypothetical protein
MDHLIYQDSELGSARLIGKPPAGSREVPVLHVERDGLCGDFGPADILADPWSGSPSAQRVAEIVYIWTICPERTETEREAARLFLWQWPDGPQLAERVDVD